MIDILSKRYLYFLVSLLVIVPGIDHPCRKTADASFPLISPAAPCWK